MPPAATARPTNPASLRRTSLRTYKGMRNINANFEIAHSSGCQAAAIPSYPILSKPAFGGNSEEGREPPRRNIACARTRRYKGPWRPFRHPRRRGRAIRKHRKLKDTPMAGTKSLTATVRDGTGKGAARGVRREGRIPGVIYGGGDTAAPISLDYRELNKLIYAGHFLTTIFELDVG